MSSVVAEIGAPFVEFAFMRRALVATFALALAGGPLGCLLVIRRMSLMGEAMAHAVLPGAAAGFLLAGFSLPAMGVGGFVAALAVAVSAGAVARATPQGEDASFSVFYLCALALGVLLVSLGGAKVDLQRMLFGSVLAVDDEALLWIASITTASLLVLALAWRPLILGMLDGAFLRQVGGPSVPVELVLATLLVANLVSAFQAMGTLMALGLLLLPAAAAQFWAAALPARMAVATAIGMIGGGIGLLVSFHAELPSGPAIVLACGVMYAMSLLFGARHGLLVERYRCAGPIGASRP